MPAAGFDQLSSNFGKPLSAALAVGFAVYLSRVLLKPKQKKFKHDEFLPLEQRGEHSPTKSKCPGRVVEVSRISSFA